MLPKLIVLTLFFAIASTDEIGQEFDSRESNELDPENFVPATPASNQGPSISVPALIPPPSVAPEEDDCNEQNSTCNPAENHDTRQKHTVPVIDLDEIINTFGHIDLSKADWRKDLKIPARNRYILQKNLFADSTFIVGPDDNQTEIGAHRVILQSASPLLEKAFAPHVRGGRTKLRLRNVSPEAMLLALDFMYTGEICLEDFNVACELVNLASRLQLDTLSRACHSFLYDQIYPNNIWRAYMCGVAANDSQLKEAASFFTQLKTDEALLDPKFTEIPQDAFVEFLSRDNLNVSSELKLYEAALRWAMAETLRKGLPPGPQSLRDALNPVIKYIRFLLFTPTEFANIQYITQVLSYTESLAIMFSLNSTNVMDVPEGFSNIKTKRITTFSNIDIKSGGDASISCPDVRSGSTINLIKNLFTTHFHNHFGKHWSARKIYGVQIPIRKPRTEEGCNTLEPESLVVTLLDSGDRVLATREYDGTVNTCAWSNYSENEEPPEDLLMNVLFFSPVELYDRQGDIMEKVYKIKVKFNKQGLYPLSLGVKTGEMTVKRNKNGNFAHVFSQNRHLFVWMFGEKEFAYSLLTENW